MGRRGELRPPPKPPKLSQPPPVPRSLSSDPPQPSPGLSPPESLRPSPPKLSAGPHSPKSARSPSDSPRVLLTEPSQIPPYRLLPAPSEHRLPVAAALCVPEPPSSSAQRRQTPRHPRRDPQSPCGPSQPPPSYPLHDLRSPPRRISESLQNPSKAPHRPLPFSPFTPAAPPCRTPGLPPPFARRDLLALPPRRLRSGAGPSSAGRLTASSPRAPPVAVPAARALRAPLPPSPAFPQRGSLLKRRNAPSPSPLSQQAASRAAPTHRSPLCAHPMEPCLPLTSHLPEAVCAYVRPAPARWEDRGWERGAFLNRFQIWSGWCISSLGVTPRYGGM